jgi:hypothetical protein
VGDLIFDVEIEALRENGDWVTLHRTKPIEPHFSPKASLGRSES